LLYIDPTGLSHARRLGGCRTLRGCVDGRGAPKPPPKSKSDPPPPPKPPGPRYPYGAPPHNSWNGSLRDPGTGEPIDPSASLLGPAAAGLGGPQTYNPFASRPFDK
jgi:hypothetical protein